MDFYGFYTGQEFEAYKYLGAHPAKAGTAFRTFAPKASKISVIGDFSQWQELEMKRIYDGNFWEAAIPEAQPGMRYKFRIYRADGTFLDHCDPYGFSAELRPGTAMRGRTTTPDLPRAAHPQGKAATASTSASCPGRRGRTR